MSEEVKIQPKRIKLERERTNKAINETEDILKHAINFELRLLDHLGRITISECKSHF